MTNVSYLTKAMKIFSKEPTQKMYNDVLLALVRDSRNDEAVHIPVEINKAAKLEESMVYGMVKGSDNKYYYIICANTEELYGSGYEVSVLMKLYDILTRSFSDTDIGGVCIDPWSSGNCVITNDYIGALLRLIDSDEEL